MFLLGRILFGGTLLFMGSNHFLNFSAMVDYAATKGILFPGLSILATGAVLVGGGFMVAAGYKPKLGAFLLSAFLIAAAFLVHDFWTIEDAAMAQTERVNFLKNLALAGGGLLILYIPKPWAYSLESGSGDPERAVGHPSGQAPTVGTGV